MRAGQPGRTAGGVAGRGRAAAVRAVAWASVGAALIGFVLPWGSVEVREPTLLRELATGFRESLERSLGDARHGSGTFASGVRKLAAVPTRVSGVQIPILANREEAKVAAMLLELFMGRQEHLGLKSYAVYVVPGLAVVCGALLTLWGARRWLAAGVGALCATVALLAVWKLSTVARGGLVGVRIEVGLWLSVWAYVGLALAAAAACLSDRAGPWWGRGGPPRGVSHGR